ncbi:hypothetical protein AB0C84_45175 [Actinomadura sp. NPDC048955]|uniref:hypothetical protein n=1 Tax=Actinomadura sp. NPDC048955 TaxID=3158228 RepID=UPI0033F36E04
MLASEQNLANRETDPAPVDGRLARGLAALEEAGEVDLVLCDRPGSSAVPCNRPRIGQRECQRFRKRKCWREGKRDSYPEEDTQLTAPTSNSNVGYGGRGGGTERSFDTWNLQPGPLHLDHPAR